MSQRKSFLWARPKRKRKSDSQTLVWLQLGMRWVSSETTRLPGRVEATVLENLQRRTGA